MQKTFRLGTRASLMALRQSEAVLAALRARFPDEQFELVKRVARADADYKSRLGAFGGKGGAFVEDMRQMMRDGEADMAMHSLKDLPGNEEYYQETAFALGCCLPRDDARDALVLKAGTTPEDAAPAVIGTSSIRRRAFLHRLFPHAAVVPFRGSADLRLKRLDGGIPMEFNYGGRTPPLDALVLARSGLERIDQGHRVSRIFAVEEMCPAVGQGVVVVEHMRGHDEIARMLAAINDVATTYAWQAERAMLRVLEGHCDSPIAGHAWMENGLLHLKGVVIAVDGKSLVEVSDATESAAPADLGTRLGDRLNALGAQTIIEESRHSD